ncbi:MAG: sugar phosphate nucleotidyltransferase [Candidatus Kapabacteria bacterium]|jgi:mannose-1-phosphate guanylyltransferase|nr:sugar phosphate nucleotidyltransferase [Candidatus Kapabacteria bacterium]
MKRTALIMAGGSGERFWPLSRKRKPKQLLPLAGEKTMIEESIDRISALIPPEDVFIITGEHLLEPLRNGLPSLPPQNIIAEPYKRNTAPCLALGASFIEAKYAALGIKSNEISIAVLTADQNISPLSGFIKTVDAAMNYVENNPQIATIGIPPNRPETGYGYIETKDRFSADNDTAEIKPVLAFREKPSLKTAREFLAAGNYLWNSGMFFWRLDTFKISMIKNCPSVGDHIDPMRDAYLNMTDDVLDDALPEAAPFFKSMPNTSIDYGLMERADNTVVARALFDWDDIGSWDSLDRIREKDSKGNISEGVTALTDVTDSIIINQAKDRDVIIAGVGLDNTVIVVTDDAGLVCPKDRVQEVKKCVEIIKEDKNDKWL